MPAGERRENLEEKALASFARVADRHGHRVFRGQSRENRIHLGGNLSFQFGDLRVDLPTLHVVIEAESAGGVTNLTKYRYAIEVGLITRPVELMHLFRRQSVSDYGSHLRLWDFLWERMSMALAGRMRAMRYGYRDTPDLGGAARRFEALITASPSPAGPRGRRSSPAAGAGRR